MKRAHAFTLIELLMALAACAIILAAIFGVLSRAIHLRDNATQRTRDAQIRAHAASMVRNDLRNALVSGGKLAAKLEGSLKNQGGGFPGYLKFTATTAKDEDDELGGDVQEIEYFVKRDTEAEDQKSGVLVRTVKRDILDTTTQDLPEERVLARVESMSVSFYSSNDWKTSWELTETEKTLPEAVRVIIQLMPKADGTSATPIEVLVPWTTQPAIVPATTTSSTSTGGGN